MSLVREEIERAKFTFSIYDFDGSGKVDAFQLGNALRAMGLNPTLKKISNLGGTIRRNEKMLTVEEFLAVYQEAKQDKDEGTMEDYMECLRSHDKDSSGKLSVSQLGHLLQAYGEKLDRDEAEEVISDCGGRPFDDMVDYKSFLTNLLRGPENRLSSPTRERRGETEISTGDTSGAAQAATARQNSFEASASASELPVDSETNLSPISPSSTSTSLRKGKPKPAERRASSDISSTSDTSGGDISKAAVGLKSSKGRTSSVTPEVKSEPPPTKAKFQQPLISLKTDGLFGKRK